MKPKTAKAALCKALLAGEVLNVRNCAEMIGLSNIAREIPRMVEDVFGVVVSRTHMTGKTRYGTNCNWTNYRLNFTSHNAEGIKKMVQYIAENDPSAIIPAGVKVEPKTGKNITDKNKIRNVVSDVYRKNVSKTV